MPNLNIEVDQDLLRAIRVKAAAEDVTRRDWVVQRLTDALMKPETSTAKQEETARR